MRDGLKLKLASAMHSADKAWGAELVRTYGKSAANARYDARGRSTPTLKRLDDARSLAVAAWESADALGEITAAPNNPALAGQPAAQKRRFGQNGRYALFPVHSRFDAVDWFIADAEHELSTLHSAEVIRQESTLEAALGV
jgi:hypothetical protein